MLNYLHNLIICTNRPLGTVIHLGAGRGKEVQAYIDSEAQSIVLVEGDDAQAAALRAKTIMMSNVSIVPMIATAEPMGTAELLVYNDTRFSSVLEPGGIREIFPNIAVSEIRTNQSTTIAELIEKYGLHNSLINLLVLDNLGIELEMLQSLKPESLSLFDLIVLRAAEKPLYKQSHSQADVSGFLLSNNFEPWYCKEQEPYYQEIVLRQNTRAVSLQLKIDEAATDREKVLGELATLKQKLAQESSSFQVLKSKKQKLKKDKKTIQAELKEASTQIESLASEITNLNSTIHDMEGRIRESSERLNQMQVENLALSDTKFELANRLESSEASFAARLSQLESLLAEANEHRDALEAAEAQLKSEIQNAEQKYLEAAVDIARHREDSLKLQTEIQSLQSQIQEASAYAARLQQDNEKLQSQNEHSEQQNHEASGHTSQLVEQNRELLGRISEQDNQIAHLSSVSETFQQREKRIDDEIAETEQERRLANKLVAKLQIDLDDLRIRYREKQEKEEKLVKLIVELRDKLEVASRHYFSLQQQHPELLREEMD